MKPRALVLCDDTWHPAEIVRSGLDALGDGDFDFEFLEDGRAWSAERMTEFPLVILAKANITSSKIKRPWLAAESQHLFPDFVRRGNGLVVIHSGASRYEKLPAMNALIGGAFVSHPDSCAVTMEPKSGCPLTAGVAPFTVRDEHYFMTLDEAQADVFLRSRSEHGVQPAGWTRTEGEGRVCVLTPGHSLEVWLHPAFQKLLYNALRWAAKMN
jgi:type 1 glutamine amidotransferase